MPKLSISISDVDYEWLRNGYGASPSRAIQKLIQETRDRSFKDLQIFAQECGR